MSKGAEETRGSNISNMIVSEVLSEGLWAYKDQLNSNNTTNDKNISWMSGQAWSITNDIASVQALLGAVTGVTTVTLTIKYSGRMFSGPLIQETQQALKRVERALANLSEEDKQYLSAHRDLPGHDDYESLSSRDLRYVRSTTQHYFRAHTVFSAR